MRVVLRIRTQLALALCGMAAAAFVLAGAVAALYARDLQAALIALHGNRHALVLKTIAETGRPVVLQAHLRHLKQFPGVRAGYLVDARGVILQHSLPGHDGEALAAYEAARGGEPPTFSRPARLPGGAGEARVEMMPTSFLAAFDEAGARQRLKAGLFLLLAVALALALALTVAFALTRPLARVVAAARGLGAGDLSVTAPSTGGLELRQLADQFNEMARRLRRLDEFKDEWISHVSHDLRSPLAAIRMYADFMIEQDKDEDKLSPRQRERAGVIADNAMRLGVFVGNILDAAKLKAGRLEHHPQLVSVDVVFGQVAALFGVMARQKGVALDVEVPAGLPPVYADPERLERVLVNLVSNALKFTEEGGRVALGAKADGEATALWVSDTGRGIPKDRQARLFERFFQVDAAAQKAERVEGTGLGLHIVKRAVEEMGGSIAVDSEPGRGSRFTVRLAAAPAPIRGPV